MFIDPHTAKDVTAMTTVSAPLVLPRTSASINYGQFSAPDGNAKFTVQHAYGKRVRRVARYDIRAIVADPLLTGVNAEQSMSVYLVVDVPRTGFTVAIQRGYVQYLTGWLGDSSFANTVKFLGGES
jgi:hypothetical protein